MKKTIVLLSGILAAIFIFLSILDPDYALEKKLWQLNKRFKRIAHDTQSVQREKFGRLIGEYKKLINRFPRSSQIPWIYLQMGYTYALHQDWEEARKSFKVVVDQYPQSPIADQALLEICKSYEEQGDSAKTLECHREIIETYPLTGIGLNSPLFIVDYYLQLKQPQKARQAIAEAIESYKGMSEKDLDCDVHLRVLRRLSSAYSRVENWENAFEALQKVIVEWPTCSGGSEETFNEVVKSINSIAIIELKDYDRLTVTYKAFIQQSPKHKLAPKIKEIIKALEQDKTSSGLSK